MRAAGALGSVRGLGPQDHVCFVYDVDEQLRRATIDFLEDGLRLGQRLMYVGAERVPVLRSHLTGLENYESLINDGSLLVHSLAGIYPLGRPIDCEAQLEVYGVATDEALADGFTGLRIVAEVTALITRPENWDEHTRWECAADRLAATRPIAALCAYDRRVIPAAMISTLARVHPAVHPPESDESFRIWSTPDTLKLSGEIDYFSVAELDRLLELAPRSEGDTVLDVSGLDFIEQNGLACIAKHANADANRLRVDGATPQMRELSELLDISL